MLGYDFLQILSDVQSGSDPDLSLYITNKQFSQYRPVINTITGIIFLSTPHHYSNKTLNLIQFRDILEATTNRPFKIPNTNIKQEGTILLDLADRFKGISFHTPLLSIYKLQESRNSSTTLQQKYQQLVNHKAYSTHTPIETVISLNLDHFKTYLFTKSISGKGILGLNKFIYKTFYNTINLITI
ncbi:hypothetical protein N7540_003540 [Penicillium herquei]|nr:hypothetical protein N7540_003540 [Penicillium herquei]